MVNLQKITKKTTKACDLYETTWKLVENQTFTNYENSEFEWFQLFCDGLDRQWCKK